MAENDFNNLPQGTEVPPTGEITTTPAPIEASGSIAKGDIDVTPDPTKLKSDIEELRKQKEKAEADALYWRKEKARERAEYFKGGQQVERQTPLSVETPQVGPEPKPNDFEDYDKYVDAKTKFEVKRARTEWEMESTRREQEKTQRQRAEDLQIKLQEGFGKYADFEEVVFDRTATHITPMVVDILSECEHPADVAYYLTKNRIEGVAISRMTPIQAARAIARMEDKLVNAPPPPPPKKTTTGAPPPINPLGGANTAGAEKDPDKMTMKEFREWREKHGARRY